MSEQKHCENFRAVLVADSDENPKTPRREKDLLMTRTRCKMWTCEYCARVNRNIWRARIIEHIKNTKAHDYKPEPVKQWFFVTLTAHENSHRAGNTLINLRKAWDKARKLAHKYKTCEKWHYVRVFEAHKSGELHIHMITNIEFSQRWWSTTMRRSGAGWSVDVQQLSGEPLPVASYVAKYMTKQSEHFPRNLRRINASHGWSQAPLKDKSLKWRVQAAVWERDIMAYKTVKDIQNDKIITTDDLLNNPYYPPDLE